MEVHRTGGELSTADVITSLVAAWPSVSAVFIFRYRQPLLLQSRISLDPEEAQVLDRACALRQDSGLPFWESLLLSCFDREGDHSRILQEATYHQSSRNQFERIPRCDVLDGRLADLARGRFADVHISVSSQIEINDGTLLHLPLLDFHCPSSPRNDRLVAEACRILFPSKAHVFSSGESYHAVGTAVCGEHDLVRLLARSLLLAPIVDPRYVAHQLVERACALRLNTSTIKQSLPRLVFTVE